MTKQEIEQAAKEFSKQEYNGDEPVYDDEDLFWQQICYKRGAEMVNERQPYSREDMKSAIEWFIINEWHPCDGKWCKITFRSSIFKTFDELLKLWEETK